VLVISLQSAKPDQPLFMRVKVVKLKFHENGLDVNEKLSYFVINSRVVIFHATNEKILCQRYK
jgi:hypothetical protein